MENTYTYTARSATDPSRMATFTLYDNTLAVDVGPALAQAGQALETAITGADTAEELEELIEPLKEVWLKPPAAWLMQRTMRPFSIADIDASAEDDQLLVRAWARAGGRRVAPITFSWDAVDNPDASHAFVDEVSRRKDAAQHPGRYTGPLDYWVTWLGAAFLVSVAFLWLFRQSRQEEA